MPRTFLAVLFLTIVLCACSLSGLSPAAPPLTDTASAPTDQIPPSSTSEVLASATVPTPHLDQGPDGVVTEAPPQPQDCGYQWAYQDLPALSASFQASIQELQPEAQASLFAFGEDCFRADGSKTFIPMETDFNVTLQVGDLSNESDLGEWIVKVMQVIESIPAEQIVGPRPGRVSILFQANGEKRSVKFYRDQYSELPAGLTNAEIYQALKDLQ